MVFILSHLNESRMGLSFVDVKKEHIFPNRRQSFTVVLGRTLKLTISFSV